MQHAKDFEEAVRMLNADEVMRVFTDHYLMEYVPDYRVLPIGRASYGNNFYPHVSNFTWESDRPPITVHHPHLEQLERQMEIEGMLATGMAVRPTINVTVADHPVDGFGCRVHIVLVACPVDADEYRVIDALAVLPLELRK